MTGDDTKPQAPIVSDEDWKSRVKAEDAALDQQFQNTSAPAASVEPETSAVPQSASKASSQPQQRPSAAEERRSQSERPMRFPEADMDGLIGILSTQAMAALGLIADPATHKALEPKFPAAQYFIDLISVLEQKTTGNLTSDEAAGLDEALHALRMAYIQRSKPSS